MKTDTHQAELAAFKTEERRDGGFFSDPHYGEVMLTSDPEGVIDYTDAADGEAWTTLFNDVEWVGQEADGGLVGFWNGAVLHLDNEGQLCLTGRTLVDHFAQPAAGSSAVIREAPAGVR